MESIFCCFLATIIQLLAAVTVRQFPDVQLPSAFVPFDDGIQGSHALKLTRSFFNANSIQDIIETLNIIPNSFHFKLLTTIQIQSFYQNALRRTIQIDVKQLSQVISIILCQRIPTTSIDVPFFYNVLDIAQDFMQNNGIIVNHVAFHLTSETLLLHAIFRNYAHYISKVQSFFPLIQNILFNETETNIIQYWPLVLKLTHLQTLIVSYYDNPNFIQASFDRMVELGIISMRTRSGARRRDSQSMLKLNFRRFDEIHIIWIIRWAMDKAIKDPNIETILILCDRDKKEFILNYALKGMIKNHFDTQKSLNWISLLTTDIVAVQHNFPLSLHFDEIKDYAFAGLC